MSRLVSQPAAGIGASTLLPHHRCRGDGQGSHFALVVWVLLLSRNPVLAAWWPWDARSPERRTTFASRHNAFCETKPPQRPASFRFSGDLSEEISRSCRSRKRRSDVASRPRASVRGELAVERVTEKDRGSVGYLRPPPLIRPWRSSRQAATGSPACPSRRNL